MQQVKRREPNVKIQKKSVKNNNALPNFGNITCKRYSTLRFYHLTKRGNVNSTRNHNHRIYSQTMPQQPQTITTSFSNIHTYKHTYIYLKLFNRKTTKQICKVDYKLNQNVASGQQLQHSIMSWQLTSLVGTS